MRLTMFAMYLGIGAMCHAIFIGPHFDWSSAWTFGWLFGWPLMFFVSFWAVILGVAVAVCIIAALWTGVRNIAQRRERRRYRASTGRSR